jgi:hypothetical protein
MGLVMLIVCATLALLTVLMGIALAAAAKRGDRHLDPRMSSRQGRDEGALSKSSIAAQRSTAVEHEDD